MRATPSLETTGTSSNYAVVNTQSGNATCNSGPLLGGDGSSNQVVNLEAGASNMNTGGAAQLMSNNNKTSFLAFSAEL